MWRPPLLIGFSSSDTDRSSVDTILQKLRSDLHLQQPLKAMARAPRLSKRPPRPPQPQIPSQVTKPQAPPEPKLIDDTVPDVPMNWAADHHEQPIEKTKSASSGPVVAALKSSHPSTKPQASPEPELLVDILRDAPMNGPADQSEQPIEKTKPASLGPVVPALKRSQPSMKPGASTSTLKFISNGAPVNPSNQPWPKEPWKQPLQRLPSLPPVRQVQGPDYPRAHLMSLPRELRDQIFDHVFDSALVIMTTCENFGRNIHYRCMPCSSPADYNTNGIPTNVFPCLATPDAKGRLQVKLADRLFDEVLHYKNLPYQRGKQVEECERNESDVNTQILFINKRLASEFAPILYQRTLFAFGSSVAIRKLLNGQDKLATR